MFVTDKVTQTQLEMMKRIHLLLLLLAATLASCSSDSFKIDGALSGLDGPSVHIICKADTCMVDEWVDLDAKGKFSFEGQSAEPVIVNLLNQRGDVLTTVVAANGDHLKLKGDAGKPMGIKVKGNNLNEQWQTFRDENKDLYTDANRNRLDAAIEKYVREHPAELLSTVLLLVDYSDYSNRAKVGALLKSIHVEARPESLIRLFVGDPMSGKKVNLPRLTTLTLYKHDGGFEEVKLTDHVTLLTLWAQPQDKRADVLAQVRALQQKADGKVRVIDILTEGDTLRWHKTIAGEDWGHYWAPSGPVEQGVQLLGITSLPWYAVSDSTGLIVYSGPILTDAVNTAMSKVTR